MSTMFYIGFFGWPVIIAATIFLNWYRIEKLHSKPHYFSSNWSRGIFGFAFLALMAADKNFDPGYLSSWISVFPEVVYILSSFYLFFDAGLNGLRGKKWDYKGDDSGWLDSMKIALYYVLKGLCLIALVWSSVILWH